MFEVGSKVWIYPRDEKGNMREGIVVSTFEDYGLHYVVRVETHIDPVYYVREYSTLSDSPTKEIMFYRRTQLLIYLETLDKKTKLFRTQKVPEIGDKIFSSYRVTEVEKWTDKIYKVRVMPQQYNGYYKALVKLRRQFDSTLRHHLGVVVELVRRQVATLKIAGSSPVHTSIKSHFQVASFS